MSSRMRLALLAGLALVIPAAASAETLSLDQAIARAVAAAPSVAAQEAAVRVARAGRIQAGSRPNPVVSGETENFVGSGGYGVFRQAETTVSYAQTIERGGKRDARIAYAERDIGVAQASARVARLDLAAEVQRAYIDLQIAGEVVWLAGRQLETEQALQKEALRRVRGYKDPLFVETRAAARIARATLELAETRARQASARALLASFWGESGEALEILPQIEQPADAPGRELATAYATLTRATVERAQAAVVVEQARAAQDYTLSGGVRHLRETGDVALVAGVSIPLGRFDRNGGNIERARAERERIEFEAEAARLQGLRQLASLGAEASAARTRADGIMHEVYPKAVKTLEQVREGYNRGGFRFSDVQDAADALVGYQREWVETMNRYRDIVSQIDRLTGRFDAAAPAETVP